jgi:hypothetical protein
MLDELEELLVVDDVFDVVCRSTRAVGHRPHRSNDRQQTTFVSSATATNDGRRKNNQCRACTVVGVDCCLLDIAVPSSSVGRGMAAEATGSHGRLSPVTRIGCGYTR